MLGASQSTFLTRVEQCPPADTRSAVPDIQTPHEEVTHKRKSRHCLQGQPLPTPDLGDPRARVPEENRCLSAVIYSPEPWKVTPLPRGRAGTAADSAPPSPAFPLTHRPLLSLPAGTLREVVPQEE